MKSRILLASGLLLTALSSNAGLKTINVGSIEKVYAGYESGNVFFLVEDAGDNPTGCSATSESYPVLGFDATKSNTDHALSLLLAAQASGKQAEVRIRDDECVSNHVSVERIAIY